MSCCTCSARALELFVKHIAGINIGRPRPARLAITSRKPLGSHSFPRSLQTANTRIGKNTHVPFRTLTGEEARVQCHGDEGERSKASQSRHVDGERHAEVAINNFPEETLPSKDIPLSSGMNLAEPQQLQQRVSEAAVDEVRLRNLHISSSTPGSENSPNLITPILQTWIARRFPAQSQRIISRKLRKTRREAEGKYRPRAQEVQQKFVDHQASIVRDTNMLVQPDRQKKKHVTASVGSPPEESADKDEDTSVLDLINGLEGPEVKLEKPKTIDPQIHKAAKKLKYDKMLADKAVMKKKALLAARKPPKEPWQVQKTALEHKFGAAGWNPRKRLSPDTLEGIRAIHASDPVTYTTETLSEHFKITPEAIRRILKSKWKASEDEQADRRARWERRGVKKWEALAGLGVRPPVKWRAMGVGSEKGVKPERVPKRTLKRGGDGSGELSWDEVVADLDDGAGFAARIL